MLMYSLQISNRPEAILFLFLALCSLGCIPFHLPLFDLILPNWLKALASALLGKDSIDLLLLLHQQQD
jgi:hypothetical protein